MNVFISWSGDKSQTAAALLRRWLPQVIHNVDAFLSTEDISKGAPWLSTLKSALEASPIGVIVLTRENFASPWLHFEAGILAHTLGASRVCPVLLDLEPFDVVGPLSQFQFTLPKRDDFLKLVCSINRSLGELTISEEKIIRSFSAFWPELEKELIALGITSKESSIIPARTVSGMLDALMGSIQSMDKGSKYHNPSRKFRSSITDASARDALASMSHELRTPLMVLFGFIEVLQANLVTNPDELERIYSVMADQAIVMQEMISVIGILHGSMPHVEP